MGFLAALPAAASAIGTVGGLFGSKPQAQSIDVNDPAALAQQQQFLNALQGQNGIQNQSNVYNQLQAVASGQGPNPAQAQLAQATSQNVANQAALMAGQRGAGANAGLIARQAAMQGANTQQQAAQQAALMQAQQSLGALGQLGGLATQQVGQQQAANQQLIGNQLATQGQRLQNAQQVNAFNSPQAQQVNAANIGAIQGAVQGVGNALGTFGGSSVGLAHGGEVHAPEHATHASSHAIPHHEPRSSFGRHLKGLGPNNPKLAEAHKTPPAYAHGGKVDAMLSPGEKYLSPEEAKEVAQGRKNPMEGKTVPGKAKVKGDSLTNDVVPATLEEGGVVIPRSILESKNPAAEAAKFVKAHLSKKKK